MTQDHFQLGPISNLEELEVKTLQFQNQKLGALGFTTIFITVSYRILFEADHTPKSACTYYK